MKAIVCVKQVPDTSGKVAVNPDGTLNRASMQTITNPDDLNAVEAALKLKDATGCKVVVITMGPPPAEGMLRELIARGADEGVLVSAREFGGSDTFATSQILAAAVKKVGLEKDDIVFCGRQAIDGDTAQVGSQIAEKLDIPQVSYVAGIEKDGDKVVVKRMLEDGHMTIETQTPCLLTCIKELNEPRYMSIDGIYATYNSGAALMKWRYKSELRVKTLLWRVLCQQRLAGQYHTENVYGLVLGDSMELGYQILTSTGGVKHDYFMLDGSYDHFYFLTNDHQGEGILALLCDPAKTAELDRILSQGLTVGNPVRAIEQDAAEPDGTPVLFGYFCDLPRIVRFNTSLELMERPGTLICFDFQADVLRRYCGGRVRLQTIDFTKFEGRLFP